MKFHNKKIRRCSRSGGSNFNVHSFQRLEDRRLLATFTVTNTVDEVVMAAGDSPGSLRQAIFDANALAGADTITFDSSVFTGGDSSLIRLTSGELEITESLTIDASSGIDVTITGDANGDDVTLAGNITDVSASFGETEGAADDLLDDNSRVLNFSSTGDLTLESLAITGGHTRGRNADGGGIRTVNNISLINSTVSGNSSGEYGGGIYAQLGNVTLTNSTVSRNATTDDYSRGGGINARRGNVTLTNSTVSENLATSGGGIFASFGNMTLTGNVTLINSTVSGNLTHRGFEGSGGGINARSVTLTDSTVSGNSNNNYYRPRGGGIFASDVTLTNSMVSENTVTAEYGSGGGIYSQDVTAINSTISGNSAFFGGGGIRSEGTLTLSNSTISGNSTLSGGGGGIGIVYANDSVVTVTNSTISGNSSSSRAGAIAFFEGGLLTVHNSIIAGNSARIGNNNFFGTDTFNLENSIIDDTTGTTLPVGNGNLLDVDFTTVLETEVVDGVTVPLLSDNGGPVETIALLAGSPAIDAGDNALAVDATGNPLTTDQRGDGFARFLDGDGDGTVTVDIGAFEAEAMLPAANITVINTNALGPGSLAQAIIDANNNAGADTIIFDTSVFTGGDASLIRLTNGELEITDSLTIDASSGVDVTITGDANGDDITLSGNITDVSASLSDTGALLDDNSRVLNFSSSTGDLTLVGLTITGGRTSESGADGGGISSVGDVILINSTVSGNVSGADGGGISSDGDVTLTNSSVSGNSAGQRGGGIRAYRDVTLTDSEVSENLSSGYSVIGGGIFASRDVTLSNSTVSENEVRTTNLFSSGGGIFGGRGVTVTNSTVSGNTARFGGGGIRSSGVVTLSNSTVSGNTTTSGGGGGIAILDNSTFSGNLTTGAGGIPILDATDSVVTFSNSTVSGNSSSSRGGAIAFFEDDGLASLTIHNSVVAGNSARIGNNNFTFQGPNTFIVENSIIDDTTDTTLTAGNGNQLDVDFATVLETEVVDGVTVPLLTDNGGPVETIALLAGSPAIDAGNNSLAVDSAGDPLATDQRGDDFERFIDGDNNGAATVDIGAFEFGSSFLLGDVNQDGAVDFLDISPFIGVLAASGSQAEADVNQDGVVNFLDISPFIVLLSSQGSGSSAAFSASLEPANDEPVAQLSVSSSNSSRRISEGISVQLVQSPSEPLLSSSDVTGTELRAGISGPSPLAFVSGSQVQGADDDLRDLRIEPPVSNSDLAEVPNNTGNESSSQPDAFAIPANGPTSSSDLFDARPDLLDGLADPQLDDVLAGLLV